LDDRDVVGGEPAALLAPRRRQRDAHAAPDLTADPDGLEVSEINRIGAVGGGRHAVGRDQRAAADSDFREPWSGRPADDLAADDGLRGNREHRTAHESETERPSEHNPDSGTRSLTVRYGYL
jgi:hypothetical protein